MGKAEENKKTKRDSLLNTAFELFTSQGLSNTSISDIALRAGVAKGTFYLYFKDKYDIRNHIIVRKSEQFFNNAYADLKRSGITDYTESILFLTDHILDALCENKPLLAFIHKDLSWGVFRSALESGVTEEQVPFQQLFLQHCKDCGVEVEEPEVMLFFLVELIGSTAYSSIIHGDPIPPEELKKHLHKLIPGIIRTYTQNAPKNE